ncbi:hypothetical protein COT99_03260 [Candidatus Falkowbacteria bacterium CG10_big_fil_rev_8_21_14_0_10_43_10]|uniref:Uncharacterized protein n=1 Tax=Candidatus Falkowbacteria bacterium CG10_big_fil_rev_8_21_14_0_10_43_10 TaxID=1974567 RepID=A0A2H0V1K9_9BACT|nr:MAG: hypothetical protein COT99_03260 [Candidatus Falkowbacteria bacterium CG10_big_fil_rev_8_21_14_0_10_43_10]
MNLSQPKAIRNQKMRYFFIAGLLVILYVSMFVFDMLFGAKAQGKVQSYSSGDAIVWNNEIYVGSVDTDKLELFKQAGDKLIKEYAISAPDERWNDFYDFAFNIEADVLYAYAVNGKYLYKYNLTDISNPVIVGSVKDNSWDWMMRVQKAGDNIATVGTNGIRIWNNNLMAINSYANQEKNDNITLSRGGEIIFDIKTDYGSDKENDFIKIISSQTRAELASPRIVLNSDRIRQPYYDADKKLAYFAGDRVLKQVNLTTGAVNNFQHISAEGFAVDGIFGKDHFYFTDGIGIVKMNHELKPLSWQHAYKIGLPNAWCMGLKALEQNGQERLAVFNHESIVILDENFKLVASYKATEDNNTPRKPLSMSIDRNRAARNSQVSLRGAGFAPQEEIALIFGRPEIGKMGELVKDIEFSRVVISADEAGRFTKVLTVPDIKLGRFESFPYGVDIIAKGLNSGLRYSIGFTIE